MTNLLKISEPLIQALDSIRTPSADTRQLQSEFLVASTVESESTGVSPASLVGKTNLPLDTLVKFKDKVGDKDLGKTELRELLGDIKEVFYYTKRPSTEIVIAELDKKIDDLKVKGLERALVQHGNSVPYVVQAGDSWNKISRKTELFGKTGDVLGGHDRVARRLAQIAQVTRNGRVLDNDAEEGIVLQPGDKIELPTLILVSNNDGGYLMILARSEAVDKLRK